MEVIKQLELLISGSKTKLLYCLICLCIWGCQNNKKDSEVLQIKIIEEMSYNISRNLPDTSINNVLKLEDYLSASEFYNYDNKFTYIEYIRESPIVLFLSSDGKEYLMAYQYEGNTKNTFSFFEIGYNDTILTKLPSIKTNYKRFYTESGISLGISLKELIRIKGNNYIDVNNNHTLVQYKNLADTSFLARYKMPSYSIDVELCNDVVNKIKLGFGYP